MTPERLVENMRALLCTNSPSGISPEYGGHRSRDQRGNLITVDQDEFPGVDCNEIFPNLFLGNG